MTDAALTDAERTMLGFALDLAQEAIHNDPDEFSDEDQATLDSLRRMAASSNPGPTPCSQPNPCEDGVPCDQHEEEQAHAEGKHEFCGVTCEVEFPTDALRNTIITGGIPGTPSMLAELLRRASAGGAQ